MFYTHKIRLLHLNFIYCAQEQDLLTTHHRYLHGYQYALEEVQIDEQNSSSSRNFSKDLENVVDITKFVIERLEILVSLFDLNEYVNQFNRSQNYHNLFSNFYNLFS